MSTSPLPRPYLTTIPRAPSASQGEPPRLPVSLTSLVGRERELAALANLLLDPAVRLVTLTGPGGVGKTRLALQVAADLAGNARFTSQVVVVELVAVRDPEQVVPAIAQALGLRLSPRESALTMLTAHVHDQELLLVLDNFEQVIDAGPRIAELLRSCPGLTVLATSRARLQIGGERTVIVSRLLDADAERLFVERARAVGASFAPTEANEVAVAEVCRRLDGLPLAIELAAARGALFAPPALLKRLDQRLPHLTGGPSDAPARHQTMRDAIGWSYDLLTPEQQRAFRTLGVFVGGCLLEAAETVCGPQAEGGVPPGSRKADDTQSSVRGTLWVPQSSPAVRPPPSAPVIEAIESLVHHSLLTVVPPSSGNSETGSPRVAMLETIREFALDQLQACGEEVGARDAHAGWCLTLAEAADAAYRTWTEQIIWLKRLQTEHGNFRAALSWLRDSGATELHLQLAGALAGFWYFGGHLAEGLQWLVPAIDRHQGGPPFARARALMNAGMLSHFLGNDDQAVPLVEESLIYWQLANEPWGTALSLLTLGIVAEDSGNYDQAEAHFAETLARLQSEGENRHWEAITRYHLSVVAYGRGDLDRAAALGEQALEQFGKESATWHTLTTGWLGLVAVERGDSVRAAACFAEALPTQQARGLQSGLQRGLAGVATLATYTNRPHEAARLFGAADAISEASRLSFEMPERATFERATATVRARLGEPDFAAAWAAGRALSREDAVNEALAFVTTPLATPFPSLTPRETEVLLLLAEGKADAAIAESLFLSVRTVENHVARILAKLGVHSRADAASLARDARLTPDS